MCTYPRGLPLAVEFFPFREKSRNQKTFSSKLYIKLSMTTEKQNIHPHWAMLRDIANEETARLISALPPQIREKVRNIPIIFQQSPSPSLIADGVAPDVMGLFVGDDFPHEASSPVTTEIFLFLFNIWDEAQAEMPQYRAEVRLTLLHEWGHYLGLDEDELTERTL